MTSQITIIRGPLSRLDPDTGLVSGLANATTIYKGKARIALVSGAGTTDNSGAPIDGRVATISIPMSTSAVPYRDDVITVQVDSAMGVGNEADADLDNRVFRVLDVDGGTFFGDARRISCASFFPSRGWGSS